MTILAFWPVGYMGENIPERDTFDCVTHEEAFKELWEKRKKWNVRFYDMESFILDDAHGLRRHFGVADEFEEDYNNEELDGGYWCKALLVPSDYVKQVIGE